MKTQNATGGKILITGGTSGLGLELVKSCIWSGFEVYTIGRDSSRLMEFIGNVHFIRTDLADFADVVKAAKELIKISGGFDVIINNAGVLSPADYTVTTDGMEHTFQVNFLSQLLLNILIIKEAPDSNPMLIASVTSPVFKYFHPQFVIPERAKYHPLRSYAESKIYLLMTGSYLKKLFPEKNISYTGFDPGTFSSGIYRMQKKWFQILYSIAGPFMRHPQKIASFITDIIIKGEVKQGIVYRYKKRSLSITYLETGTADRFMDECYDKVKKYL